jgi:5-methylcytosine-specific restriction protein A
LQGLWGSGSRRPPLLRHMPTRLCLNAGCPHPATYRGRCPDHARTTNRTTHRNRTIYNSKRWATTREAVLFLHPLCACGCEQIATDVDHIKPIEQGGDPWARQNLQSLAHDCHARKTRSEQRSGS